MAFITPHSDELKETVRDLHRRGETYRSIAKKVGLTRNAIAGLCSRMGLCGTPGPSPSSIMRSSKDRDIRRLLLAGATVREVAEEVEVSPETVRQRRKAFGIAPTHHGDRRRVRSAPQVLLVEKAPGPIRAPDPATAVAFTKAEGCRYALWSGDERDLNRKRVCGGSIAKGSYCAFHASLVYVPYERRRAA